MDTAVRQLVEQEWRVLRSVRLRALRDSPSTFETTAKDAAEWPSSAWRAWLRTSVVFIATDATTVFGMVASAPRTQASDRGLAAMWVDAQRRGNRVGTELLQAHLTWARHDGGSRVTLWVDPTNTSACKLYKAFGFCPTGSAKDGRHGEVVELAMTLAATGP